MLENVTSGVALTRNTVFIENIIGQIKDVKPCNFFTDDFVRWRSF